MNNKPQLISFTPEWRKERDEIIKRLEQLEAENAALDEIIKQLLTKSDDRTNGY